MLRRLAENVVSNWANAVVAAVLALVVTPYVIEGLKDPGGGNHTYGVWTFIVSLSAYFGLLDLGFFQGALQYFTRYRTQGRNLEFNRVISTAVATLLVLGGLGGLAALAVAWRFPSMIDIGQAEMNEVRLAFLVSALAIIARVPLQMFAAVIVGCQRFPFFNGVIIVGRLVTAAGVVWAVSTGRGLLGIAVATAFGTLVGQVALIWAAFRVEPSLHLSIDLVDRSTLREMFAYGKWMFSGRLYDLHLANVDLIIVPLLFGAEALAVYGIAVSLVAQAQVGVQGFTFAIAPSAIVADASKSKVGMQSLLLQSSRIGLLLSGGIVLCAVFWGEDFISQWLDDPSFLGEAQFVSAATILSIVALDRILLKGIVGPQQALIGMRRARELSLIKFGQGALSVILAYGLGQRFGILAVPWSLLGSALAGRVLVTLLGCRLAGVAVSRFSREVLLPALLALGVAGGAGALVTWIVDTAGWWSLGLQVSLFGAIGLVSAVVLGLDPSERATLREALSRRWARISSE